MTKKEKTTPPPLLLASIVCDQVIIDSITKKPSIIGAFEHIAAVKYPARHPRLAFFCQLTNGRGKIEITIRLVDVEKSDTVIFSVAAEYEFRDVREVASLTFDVGGIVFPHPGEYRFQFSTGTEFLGERRIICRQVELPPQAEKK